ncbi:MAG: FtsW/RodA/SpoVE family cell cycle protein, partial [Prevotella sp.]|nr:FtsW/RodA/SpoVE family cell cycle protein [Prevotella sp.]
MKNKSLSNIFKGDKVIWMVFFFLCIISIIEVYSASSSLSYTGGNYWSPIIYHCSILVVGIALMVVVLNIKCRYFKLITPIVLGMSILLLAWVLAAGQSTNGASRWISFAGIQFQPSELAKGALVLAIAQILSAMQTEHGADRKAFKYIMWLSGGIILLILGENLSTAMLIGLTVILMMFVGRVPFNQLGRLIGFIVLLGVFVLSMVMLVGDDKKAEDELSAKQNLTEQTVAVQQEESPGFFGKILHRADTWKARVKKFFSNEYVAPKDYDLDKDAQVAHANIAIASSDIVGKGPGNSNERDFLSQAFSDFIYAIIIEEGGIEGAI